jgi:hypothetical protein
MVIRIEISLKDQVRQSLRKVDWIRYILPVLTLSFLTISILIELYITPSDKIYKGINISWDFLQRIALGLMTTSMSAWIVKYIVDKNIKDIESKSKQVEIFRDIYSQLAALIGKSYIQFVFEGDRIGHLDSNKFNPLMSVEESARRINQNLPIFGHELLYLHDSTKEMVECVDIIKSVLDSASGGPLVDKKLNLYGNLFYEIFGKLQGELLPIALSLTKDANIINAINSFIKSAELQIDIIELALGVQYRAFVISEHYIRHAPLGHRELLVKLVPAVSDKLINPIRSYTIPEKYLKSISSDESKNSASEIIIDTKDKTIFILDLIYFLYETTKFAELIGINAQLIRMKLTNLNRMDLHNIPSETRKIDLMAPRP